MIAITRFQLAFPNVYNFPAKLFQIMRIKPVIIDGGVDFIKPPICSGFWNNEIFTVFMPMPEAAMNKNNRFVFR